jgi:hypothetical protein
MPEKETIERAHEDEREGKSPSTQAGEFVREEMHHIREGKHGAASPQQAIAIGLSKARRAGVKLRAPKRGRASSSVRRRAQRDLRKGRTSRRRKPSSRRSRAVRGALRRFGRKAASRSSLSRQARRSSRRRGRSNRRAAAMRAARTRSRTTRGRFTRSHNTRGRFSGSRRRKVTTMKRRPQRTGRSRSQHRRAA